MTMPEVAAPEDLKDLDWYYRQVMPGVAPALRRILAQKRPFEFRPTEPPSFLAPTAAQEPSPRRNIWFRAVAALPDDEVLHRSLLAYVSDYNLLDTAMMPHAASLAA